MPSFVLGAALRRHFPVSKGFQGSGRVGRRRPSTSVMHGKQASCRLPGGGVGGKGGETPLDQPVALTVGPKRLMLYLLHTLNFAWTLDGRHQDLSQGSLWGRGSPRPRGQPWLGHQPWWQPLNAPEPWVLCLSNVESHRVDGRKQRTLVRAFSQCSANRTFPGLSVT